MRVSEVVESKRESRGIPVAELARRVRMNYEVLRRFLEGTGGIKGVYLVTLCRELDIKISDFDGCTNEELLSHTEKGE